MDVVGKLMEELKENSMQFSDTDGYDRLLEALWAGSDSSSLRRALRDPSDYSGDLLWVIAELEEVEPFVSGARQYLASSDRGTAAKAVEIVLRGSRRSDDLCEVFERLREDYDVEICTHALRTLWGVGITRLIVILEAVGYEWSCALAQKLAPSMEPFCRKEFEGLVEGLVIGQARDRQVVGLTLANLIWQEDTNYVSFFLGSDEVWIRKHGEYLESISEHQVMLRKRFT